MLGTRSERGSDPARRGRAEFKEVRLRDRSVLSHNTYLRFCNSHTGEILPDFTGRVKTSCQ